MLMYQFTQIDKKLTAGQTDVSWSSQLHFFTAYLFDVWLLLDTVPNIHTW